MRSHRPSTLKHPSLFALLAVLLLTAVGLIIYGGARPLKRTFYGKLIELLPEAPAGWTRTLRPIADSPEMQKAVGELLNFDDGMFVDYTRGSDRLSVYIAYWTPGKMSHRLVATHTPDVCWVNAGWKCKERGTVNYQFRPSTPALRLQPSGSVPLAPSHQLPPAEFRIFTANNMTEYVWFWHLVGGQLKSYGTGTTPPWHASLGDMLSRGLDQREEQFFIRLSSSHSLDHAALAPVLEPVLRALPLASSH